MDALYILSPQPHIVDCLLADFERKRYRKAYLAWTSCQHAVSHAYVAFADSNHFLVLDPQQRNRIEKSQVARGQIADFRILNVGFFPRESHLVTLRDPWSFPVLFHPGCNQLIRDHLQDLAQKVSLFVTVMSYNFD